MIVAEVDKESEKKIHENDHIIVTSYVPQKRWNKCAVIKGRRKRKF